MGRTKEQADALRIRNLNRQAIRGAVKGWAFLPHEGRKKTLEQGRAKLSALLRVQPGEREELYENILKPIEESLKTT